MLLRCMYVIYQAYKLLTLAEAVKNAPTAFAYSERFLGLNLKIPNKRKMLLWPDIQCNAQTGTIDFCTADWSCCLNDAPSRVLGLFSFCVQDAKISWLIEFGLSCIQNSSLIHRQHFSYFGQ